MCVHMNGHVLTYMATCVCLCACVKSVFTVCTCVQPSSGIIDKLWLITPIEDLFKRYSITEI